MPIKTQSDLPAKAILEHENIFVMDEDRAVHQDIRPIEIGILNLMPLRGYGTADAAFPVKFPASGRHYFYRSGEPYFKKYVHEPFEQVLPDLW